MKNLIAPLLSVILFVACNNQQAPVNKTDSAILQLPVVDKNAPLDTLVIGETKWMVYPLAESPFKEIEEVDADVAEKKALEKDAALVKRIGDSLIFKTEKNAALVLRDDKRDDDGYVKYTYDEVLPDLNAFGIKAGYYESNDYVLLNRSTGEKLNVWSRPVVSPDKKLLICPSLDLEAGFVPNGIQFLENNNGKIKVLGQAERENWGPGQIKWIDNKTFIAEYIEGVHTASGEYKESKRAVKIVMQ